MQAFLIDWGVPSDGHRINIQQPGVSAQNAFRDVGIGIVQTNPSNPSFGPMVVTQDFGSQANEQAQVVGVAYYDYQRDELLPARRGPGQPSDRRRQSADRPGELDPDLELGRIRALACPPDSIESSPVSTTRSSRPPTSRLAT